MTTPEKLLHGLAQNLDEDVMLALRYLYYVKARPVVPDALYDAAERHLLARTDLPDESLMLQPGSDNPEDYPDRVRALAFYLQFLGIEAGREKVKDFS